MDKKTIGRMRHKVRLVTFSDTLTEGYVFLAYGQRISDLLNDDRAFLPIESENGEMRVISKRAIMELEILEAEEPNRRASDTVDFFSGNAHDILDAPHDADDATIRAIYLGKLAEIAPQKIARMSANRDLEFAAEQLRKRYEAAYDSILNARQIEVIAEAVRAAKPKRRRFGDA
ncbi:MAG: hypothetical protein AAGD92_03845 [Pseudomonadota bacterium]